MVILGNPRFSAMILCLVVSIFSITLSGHLRNNLSEALFGFLGLTWLVVLVAVFVVFGWKISLLCLAGSYLLGIIVNPISGVIAGFLRGDYTRH